MKKIVDEIIYIDTEEKFNDIKQNYKRELKIYYTEMWQDRCHPKQYNLSIQIVKIIDKLYYNQYNKGNYEKQKFEEK